MNHDHYLYSVSCPQTFPPCPTVAPFQQRIAIQHAVAIYAVGFLPIGSGFDLTVRSGYGSTRYNNFSQNSFNFGAGGQYLFLGTNGLRFDYTRHVFTSMTGYGRLALGSGENVFSLSYVRTF